MLVALGALLLVLGVAPFVPRGGDEDGLVPSGDGTPRRTATAGFGRMTPALRAEVDRVVAEGRALGRRWQGAAQHRRDASRQVAAYVRCADFEGQRYCLGTGWTEDSSRRCRRPPSRPHAPTTAAPPEDR